LTETIEKHRIKAAMTHLRTSPPNLKVPFLIYFSAYVLAAGAAIASGYLLQHLHPVGVLLGADIAATLVIYLFSRTFSNASFYDAYWSVAPMAIAVYWLMVAPSSANELRQLTVVTLVLAWGLRLTWNWARQWQGLGHEDWRYRQLRNTSGSWFWLVDLAGIEMMPTLIVFLGCLSLYPALAAGGNNFGMLDVAAILVTAGAIWIEATADEQLRRFSERKISDEKVMRQGLWAYTRHPNYLGEVLFWWGLFLFALAADAGYWWTVIGPVAITLLFTLISIPLMEKRNLTRRPAYGEYAREIPALLPRLSRRQ
jgi:steroid 5-alpha reductase family enzyme